MIDFSQIIPTTWSSQVSALASQIENAVAGSWDKAVSTFEGYVQQFDQLWPTISSAQTQAIVAANPDLSTDYSILSMSGTAINEAIAGMHDALAALQSVGLGLLPLIPIAAIAIAAALVGYWVSQAISFKTRVDAINGLIAQGVPASQASAIVAAAQPQGLLSGVSSTLYAGAALAVALAIGLFAWSRSK